MRNKVIAVLLFALVSGACAQTADQHVTQGRASLAISNVVAANISFSNAVALSPYHQTGNVFRAATRLLVLPHQPAGSNFLNRLGFPLEGRDIYNWTSLPPRDTNGVPYVSEDVNASEFTSMLRTNGLAAIQASLDNLSRVTSTSFILDLSRDETCVADVTLDYGDIQMLRAALHAAEYCSYAAYACNLDAMLAPIRALYTNDQLSIERVLMDHPNLLTFATTNDLNAARTAFNNAVVRYLEASEFIRNRPTNETRLFNLDPDKAVDEEKFRTTLVDLTNSLNRAVALRVDTNYTVFLAPHFAGARTPRSMLPRISGNGFVLRTFPDTTFGGVIHGHSNSVIEDFLAKYLDPIPSLRASHGVSGGQVQLPLNVLKDHGYVIQVSTNLLNWTDVVAFVAEQEVHTFTDSIMSDVPGRFYRLVDSTQNMPSPSNDNFASRIPLSDLGITASGYIANATIEPDEPGTPWYGTAWWSWTAPSSGRVVVCTSGSPVSAWVYTGNSLAALSLIGMPNQPFQAVAGTTYLIQVQAPGGLSGAGAYTLTITAPPDLIVTSPQDNLVLTAPTNFFISASASDRDGRISKMEVTDGGIRLGSTTNSFISLTWTNVTPGVHYIIISAVDNLGVSTVSNLMVTVRPPNDNFANRIALSGARVSVIGSNAGASKEAGEPNHAGYSGGQSVWWSWTAPATGIISISTSISNYYGMVRYPLLAIYTGTSVSNLTSVVSNSPAFTGDPAQVAFTVTAGTTYQIAVDATWDESGSYVPDITGKIALDIIPTLPPVVTITSPTNGSTIFGPTNILITAVASDPDGTIRKVDFFGCDYEREYWSWIGSATNSPYSMVWSNVPGGRYDLRAKSTDNDGVFTHSQPISIQVTPPNDDFANRITISGARDSISGSNVGASKEAGEPDHAGCSGGRSVWWSWTAPSNGIVTISAELYKYMWWGTYESGHPLLGIYTGTSVSNLTLEASNAASTGDSAQVSFAATAGTTYQIAVDDASGFTGDITLKVIPTQPPVVNILSPTNGSVFFGATNHPITVNVFDPDGSISRVDYYCNSSWFGSSTDSPFGMVWSNRNHGSYTLIAKATDDSGVFTYSLPVNIEVRPSNDNFDNRTRIPGASATVTGNNYYASKEAGEPDHAGYAGGQSVWWSWTAPSNGIVSIAAELQSWPGHSIGYPLLGIYAGTSVSNLDMVASGDSSFYGYTVQASFTTTAGTTYKIAVDDAYGYTGDIALKVIPTQPPMVSITSPTNGGTFPYPGNVEIAATATDPDGSVTNVEFYLGENRIASVSHSPFGLVWTNTGYTGTWNLRARATDNAGAIGYSEPVAIGFITPTWIYLNTPYADLSGALDSQAVYRVSVPSGMSSLEISTSGGAGDCDLYVKYGAPPTLDSWDYCPCQGGNSETVTIFNPAPGDWYIMLHGYEYYEGVTLLAE
jgi:hypothetical protein